MAYQNIISELIEFGKSLYQKNYLASCDGNFSYKIDDDTIIITASGKMKGRLTEDDFVIINSKGQSQSHPDVTPSSETLMHLAVYKNQKLAKSVFHAHPPSSVAFSIAYPNHHFFPVDYISELILALGQVPIVSYQRPGTQKMGEALMPYLGESKVMILERHGVISWGESIEESYRGIERLEHAAEIYMKAAAVGNVIPLPEEEILYLQKMRKKIGFKTL